MAYTSNDDDEVWAWLRRSEAATSDGNAGEAEARQYVSNQVSGNEDPNYDPSYTYKNRDTSGSTPDYQNFYDNFYTSEVGFKIGGVEIAKATAEAGVSKSALDELFGGVSRAVQASGAWMERNKELTKILGLGISSYAASKSKEKAAKTLANAKRDDATRYSASVSGLKSPKGLIGAQKKLTRVGGTPVFSGGGLIYKG